MNITNDFKEAVFEKKILKVRIMLKDSLLVDRSFEQFNQMVHFAEDKGLDFWKADAETFLLDRDTWTVSKLNEELVELVSDFSHARVNYIKAMIRELYPIVSVPQTIEAKRPMETHGGKPHISGMVAEKVYRKANVVKWGLFKRISGLCKDMIEIYKDAKEKEEVTSSEIAQIQRLAEEIVKQCRELNGR